MKKEKMIWTILLCICVLIVAYPICTAGIFTGDDLCFHLNRIEGIRDGLLAGQFPVRIHAYQQNGYGLPTGIFYPDLFLYVPAGMRLLDVPLMLSYRIFCLLILFAMGFVSWYAFALLGRLANHKSTLRLGAVAAILYVSFWFVFLDLYKRAALGEILAAVFIPLVLVTVLSVLYGDTGKWPLAVIAVTGVCQSHLLTTIFLVMAIALLCLCSWRQLLQPSRRRACIKALVMTALINSWFFIPFLYYYFHMSFNVPFVYTDELLATIEGESWDRWSVKFFLGLQLLWGAPLTINLILFVKQWIKNRKKGENQFSAMTKGLFVVGIFLVFMCTTAFPWHVIMNLPGFGWLRLIQFPWRLMILAAPCLAFCGAVGFLGFIDTLPKAFPTVGIVCIVTCLLNITAFSTYIIFKSGAMPPALQAIAAGQPLPSFNFQGSDDYFYADCFFADLCHQAGHVLSAKDVSSPAAIRDFKKQGTTITFSYTAAEDTTIKVPLFNYMGYEAKTSDETPLAISAEADHIMLVSLPKGSNTVIIQYTGMPLFHIGEGITCIGLLWFFVVEYKEKRKKKETKKGTMELQ